MSGPLLQSRRARRSSSGAAAMATARTCATLTAGSGDGVGSQWLVRGARLLASAARRLWGDRSGARVDVPGWMHRVGLLLPRFSTGVAPVSVLRVPPSEPLPRLGRSALAFKSVP